MNRGYPLILAVLLCLCLVNCNYDWTGVNNLFRDAIAQHVFPGATLVVADAKGVLYQNAYGTLTYKTNVYEQPVTNSTKFDIASLTKIVGTTAAIMELYNGGYIKLTDLVTKYIPEYDNNQKRTTTVANLMLHSAGLLYDYPGPLPEEKNDVLSYIVSCKPDYPIGSKQQYSNLGYILLSEIVHRITNRTVKDYYTQNLIFLGMRDTVFNPPTNTWWNVAPTEYDSETRHRIIRGQAHERLAYFLDGVGGHSGLFSTSSDISRFLRLMLNYGKIGIEPRIFSEASVQFFTTRVTGLSFENYRAYGFDTYCPGTKMSQCFGHDGSTGTMMWADRSKNVSFAIMTNRGHPNVNNNLFNTKFRNQIADQIMTALGY